MRTILAVPADTHSGSDTGLLPKEGWTGLSGATYVPSQSQRVIRGQWKECWHRIRELNSKKTRLVIVHNGDAIDGVHHGTTQLVTNDIEEQKRMHIACMLEAMKIAKWNDDTDALYYMQGTFSHTATREDAIARDFISKNGNKKLATPIISPTAAGEWEDGRFVWDHLRLDINGVLFDIAHNGLRPGMRAWTKENGLTNTAKSMYFEYLDRGKRAPDYVIGSHMHTFVTGGYEGRRGKIKLFITPSMQMKTHYGHAVARFKMADIGMLFFVIEESGQTEWECPMTEFEGAEVEVL